MHELSIAQALIEQLEAIAKKEQARITAITISIGSFSGVDADALDQAFLIATDDTLLSGTKLNINRIPAKIVCHSCKKESLLEFPLLECHHCGSLDCEMTAGRDMLLQSVELEA